MERVKKLIFEIRVQDVTLGLLSCLCVYLLRFRQTFSLQPTWHIDINTASVDHILPPLVTDLDSDGVNEVIIITERMQLHVLVMPQISEEKQATLPQPFVKYATQLDNRNHKNGEPSRPIAVEAGFNEMINGSRIRSQVRNLMLSLYCFDHKDMF